jgi:hypothetical protein
LPVPQGELGASPSHAASAPQLDSHMLTQLPPEHSLGLQEDVLVHCQKLLQFPEPSHLYCLFPLLQLSMHSYPPVVQAVLELHVPDPVHVVPDGQLAVYVPHVPPEHVYALLHTLAQYAEPQLCVSVLVGVLEHVADEPVHS